MTGDGALVQFGSAVQCAKELQEGMAIANLDLPENRHIALRIGVNLGDVMVENGDVFGDAVNIAVRLEALADPGGIIISGVTFVAFCGGPCLFRRFGQGFPLFRDKEHQGSRGLTAASVLGSVNSVLRCYMRDIAFF